MKKKKKSTESMAWYRGVVLSTLTASVVLCSIDLVDALALFVLCVFLIFIGIRVGLVATVHKEVNGR